MKVTEKHIEDALVSWVKYKGGTALKGATHFDTGFPDRIIYIPDAHAHIEVKGTSKRYHLNDKQKLWAGRVIASRQPYYILESLEGLEHMKQNIEVDVIVTMSVKNQYNLNGIHLIMNINDITNVVDVTSHRTGTAKRVLSMHVHQEGLDKIIYRVFKKLEEMYPNTNYEDI